MEIDELLSGLASIKSEAGGSVQDSSWDLMSIDDARAGAKSPQLAVLASSHRRHMRKVAEYVLENKEGISGSSADWHNIVTEYFEEEDYSSALSLAEAGLERFPYDATLLADAIRSAGNIGDWQKGDELVRRAECPDYRTDENWALAVYVADFLCEKAHAQSAADREPTYERALNFVRDAIKRLPPNDRLINQEAKILVEAGRIDEARNVLEEAIFRRDTISDGVSDPSRIPVPQCCATYLDKILSDSCEYDKIIKISDAGIRFLKIEQQSVNARYFFYRKALAMDGKIHSAAISTQATGFGNQDYVRNAMNTYAIAYALDQSGAYRDACRENFLVLGVMAGVDDLKIDTFCLRGDGDASD